MPYRYLEDIATSDVAFEAWGETVEAMFQAAADAVMNVMADDVSAIAPRIRKAIRIEAPTPDFLLFQFLQELIFYKDAENLLLRVQDVHVEAKGAGWVCRAQAAGEPKDPLRHRLNADVKAVTFHRFRVQHTSDRWESTVVVDV